MHKLISLEKVYSILYNQPISVVLEGYHAAKNHTILRKLETQNQPQAINYSRSKTGRKNLGDETLWRAIL